MPDIDVTRPHTLGLEHCRKLVQGWATLAHDKLGMKCEAQSTADAEVVRFSRVGAHGRFVATADSFTAQCDLGFLLKPMRGHFTAETIKYMEAAIAREEKAQAKAKAQTGAAGAAGKPPGG